MTDIIKSLRNCEEELVLSKSQANALAEKINILDEDAQIGREYKKNLTGEVVSLCAKAMPSMDLTVFSNVAQVMTTKELMEFKKAFSKSQYEKASELQIKSTKPEQNVNQFKI